MQLHMLSTSDNPFSPWHQFDAWYAWDTVMGHHSLSYLARVAKYSSELSEADQDLAIEWAIDEILEHNVNGLYIKVKEDDVIKPKPMPVLQE